MLGVYDGCCFWVFFVVMGCLFVCMMNVLE